MSVLYTRPSDHVGDDATLSISSGTEDSDYPLANLVDRDPTKPMKFAGTSGAILFDFGSAQRVDAILIPMHNLDAALDVKWQMHTADSWGTPDVEEDFTIAAYSPAGFPPRVFMDLSSLVTTQADRTKRYARLLINAANSAAVAIGEVIVASNLRTLSTYSTRFGSKRGIAWPTVQDRTPSRVRHAFDWGVKQDTITAEFRVDDTTRQEIEDWWDDAHGPAQAFILQQPHNTTPITYFAHWDDLGMSALEDSKLFNDAHEIRAAWREVARGLPL